MRTPIATQQTINSTGPLAGMDISVVNLAASDGDWTLTARITGLSASAGQSAVTVNLEVSYDNFATVHNSVTVSAQGPVYASADIVKAWRSYQFGQAGLGFGFAGAQMRLNVTALNGTATVDVWVDN